MVMDLTEPIPAIAPPPERVLRLAIYVGITGVVALLVAVGVLIWTITGVSEPASQAVTVPADIVSKPAAAAPAAVLVPEPAPAPAPASAPAPAAAASAPAANAAAPNREILQNPTMAAIAPTSPGSVPTVTVPTVAWPNGEVPNVDWNAVGDLGLQNLAAGWLWQNSGADATTSAVIGAATSLGNNAVNFVGNNAFNLLNTLILANAGFYGGPNVPGVGLPGPDQVAAALAVPAAVIPQIGVPSVPTSIGIPGTPIGIGVPQIGPPQLPQIGPPQLPSLPGVGIGIPGTPIGIGF
jgi:hypothetical protein